jgi:energy-coupling factor transport system ATP-binding protein
VAAAPDPSGKLAAVDHLVIDIRGLRYSYPGADAPALEGLSLSVAEGESVALVGPNGSGKSTLARLLCGLDAASDAEVVRVCGHDLTTGEGRLAVRRDAGVLFQDPENQLVAENVEEDVAFGLENLGWPSERIGARVDEMLARFDLVELRRREPHLLSGGQQQRTALAGVLAIPRRLLVLDEPTAMLDAAGRDEVHGAIRRVRREGLTLVLITQEMHEVAEVDRVVALEGGQVVFSGRPRVLFADADLVAGLRLGLPPAAQVAAALARPAGPGLGRGSSPRRLPLTLEELVADLRGETS